MLPSATCANLTAMSDKRRRGDVFSFPPSGGADRTAATFSAAAPNPLWAKSHSPSSRGIIAPSPSEGEALCVVVKPTAAAAAIPAKAFRPCILAAAFATGLTCVVLGLAIGCGMGACATHPAPPSLGGGALQLVSVNGIVLDAHSNAPLSGIIVSGTSTSVTTTSAGRFAVIAAVFNGRAVLTVNGGGGASGYTPNTVVLDVQPNVTLYYKATYLTPLLALPFTLQSGLSAALSQGASVTIPAVAGGGDAPLLFMYAAVSPAAGPGTMQADTPGAVTNSTLLQSNFMVYFEARRGSDGGVVAIPPVTFSLNNLTFPTELGPLGADPLAWWQFNGVSGLWAASVPAPPSTGGSRILQQQQQQGGPGSGPRSLISQADLVAQQQGFWNSDRCIATGCTVVTVLRASDGTPCAGASGVTTGIDGIVSFATAGADGSMCLDGAAGYTSSLRVADASAVVRFPSVAGSCSRSCSACTQSGIVLRVATAEACPAATPIVTPSLSSSTSATSSASATGTASAMSSQTGTTSATMTASATGTQTSTSSASLTGSSTRSHTASVSATLSWFSKPSDTASVSYTPSISATSSPTQVSVTAVPTTSGTATVTSSMTGTVTASGTSSMTFSMTGTGTATRSAAPSLTPTPSHISCPTGWTLPAGSSKCFTPLSTLGNWTTQAAACAALWPAHGSSLASLVSDAEAAFVVTNRCGLPAGYTSEVTYLGGYKTAPGINRTGGWAWLDGSSTDWLFSPAGQSMWNVGEPNNAGPLIGGEPYLSVYQVADGLGYLNDISLLSLNACCSAAGGVVSLLSNSQSATASYSGTSTGTCTVVASAIRSATVSSTTSSTTSSTRSFARS